MNLALFDFDGTITHADTWTPFMRLSATRPRMAAAAVLLSPVIVGYKAGWIPARNARPAVARIAFAGRSATRIRELGREYARTILPGVTRPRALERIDWHTRQGDRVVVVSGSLDAYVKPWCEAHGVEAICTELEEKNGTLTGRYRGGDCSCSNKVSRIRERYDLTQFPIIYAYGDTDEDREMLDLAHEKYYRWEKLGEGLALSPQHPAPVRR